MKCPICESAELKDDYTCPKCFSWFWLDAKGAWTSGNSEDMHKALLFADCKAVR